MSLRNIIVSFGCLVNKIIFSSEILELLELVDKHGFEALFEFSIKKNVESSENRLINMGPYHSSGNVSYVEIDKIINEIKASGEQSVHIYDQLLDKIGEERVLKYYLQELDYFWPFINLGRLANRKPHHGKFYLLLANCAWPLVQSYVDFHKDCFNKTLKPNTLSCDVFLGGLKVISEEFDQFLKTRIPQLSINVSEFTHLTL